MQAAGKQNFRREPPKNRDVAKPSHWVADSMPIGAYCASPSGMISRVNQALIEMLHAPDKASLIGTRLTDRYLQLGDCQRVLRLMRESGRVDHLEVQLQTLSGHSLWVRETIRSVRDSSGCILWIDGFIEDINELREISTKAERTEESLSLLTQIALILDNPISSIGEVLREVSNAFRLQRNLSCFFLPWNRVGGEICQQAMSDLKQEWNAAPPGLRSLLEDSVDTAMVRGTSLLLSRRSTGFQLVGDCNSLTSSMHEVSPMFGDVAVVPFRVGTRTWGTMIVEKTTRPNRLTSSDLKFFNDLGSFIAVVATNSLLRAKAEKDRSSLRLLSQARMAAQEQERAHVSRELHDVIGQAMTALEYSVGGVKTAVMEQSQHKARACIRDIEHLTSEVHESIRELALGLRPSVLDDLGLEVALRGYVRAFSKRTGLDAKIEVKGLENRLCLDLETMLYRLTQEALTNSARHAEGKRIRVRIIRTASRVVWLASDDGRGFDPVKIAKRTRTHRGIGLLDMRERVEVFGGRFGIHSRIGKGTRLHAYIPLPLISKASGAVISTPPFAAPEWDFI